MYYTFYRIIFIYLFTLKKRIFNLKIVVTMAFQFIYTLCLRSQLGNCMLIQTNKHK